MRIALLTYDLPEANIVTHRLVRDLGDEIVGIVESKTIIPGRGNAGAMLALGQRMGSRYAANWLLHFALARLGSAQLKALGRSPGFGSLKSIAAERAIPLYTTRDVHGPDAIQKLKSWQPDLLVSNYFNQILREPLLDLPAIGTINMHPALLPRNRGVMPCFWALSKGDTQTGATVHWIDQGVDTGRVLDQDVVEITGDDTVVSLSARCSESGARLLRKAIDKLRAGHITGKVQDETQQTYQSWPSLSGVRRLHRRGRRYGTMGQMWAQVGRSAS
ncbi:MAG: formyltransferase family protein [Pseudomonadota bacterium]